MKTTATRRQFLKTAGLLGGAATIAIVPATSWADRKTRPPRKNAHRGSASAHGRSEPQCVGGREHRRSVRRRSRLRRQNAEDLSRKRRSTPITANASTSRKIIEGVLIATPDHTHAVISMAAMRAGKTVYCQKPLTHTSMKPRALAKAAKECGVVTQMGIQATLRRRVG